MKNLKDITVTSIAYFFVLLFIYASVSKIIDFENFQIQIAQSPLLSAYAGYVSYAVILTELVISSALLTKNYRNIGLYSSLLLMSAFTIYIYLILKFSDFVPCSCGGILEKMDWRTHLYFNLLCVLLAITAIIINEKYNIKSLSSQKSSRTNLKLLAKLFVAIFIGSTIVIALFFSSEHIIKKENNFIRRFPHHPISEDKNYDLKVNSYYFAGINNSEIILGNSTSPFLITKIDTSFNRKQLIRLKPDSTIRFRRSQIKTLDHHYFFFDGSIPVIYKGNVNDSTGVLKKISENDAYFEQLIPIDSTGFLIKSQNKEGRAMFGKINLNTFPKVQFNQYQINNDYKSVFTNDGNLIFDIPQRQVYYMPFYHSEYIHLQETHTPKNIIKTIDGTKPAESETKRLQDGSIKVSKPSVVINKTSAVYKGVLFNHSTLIGRYESKKLWHKNIVIDVYKTNPVGYWGSFYIPDLKEKKISQMLVTDQFIFVLTGNQLIRFRFAQSITDLFTQNGSSRKPLQE
ncbi:MauE/DoxX family redox-associated membrane protein [Epilithonimonas zeae]|uniref:Methylamine utilisation protein MauE domain-containing protein n=1 Tax=Epilithonimonas zeae TaxID=1416779 RepID=A0A1N6GPQ1_9FLAO|nr:MauE/DoxX family redox-associated membrane protein [Epilithonimonas zeae]SIO09521.1 hypothetical protein SAMN05444409_1975 [Epilithonimonas zeae]